MSFKFLDNYNFIPFAHRGGSYDFCENTLDAFNNSINLGYRHIETDVRHTKDNKLVIFHDPDLKRILGLDAKIENLNYDSLDYLHCCWTDIIFCFISLSCFSKL